MYIFLFYIQFFSHNTLLPSVPIHVHITHSLSLPYLQPGLGDGFRSLPHNTSQQVESFLSSIMENRPSNAPSYETGISVSSLEYGQTLMKGPLLRKDRLKWTKCYCLIRNSFFECHKHSDANTLTKPLLKLLLVGSQVSSNQVRH